jgi:hypothetical protein
MTEKLNAEEQLAKLKEQRKAAWKRWYDKHGKAYAQRRKERQALAKAGK